MMAEKIVERYGNLGIQLWEENGNIRYRDNNKKLNEALIQELRDNKEYIVTYFQSLNQGRIEHDANGRYEYFPLTDMQQAYLMGRSEVYEYGGVGCHGYIELTFNEILDIEKLTTAWQCVVNRHDMLRTVIFQEGFQQVLQKEQKVTIDHQDLRGMEPTKQEEAIQHVREELGKKQYAPESWPLYDLYISIKDEESILHFSNDMLIIDFVSADIILKELDYYYRNPDIKLPELEITYRDVLLHLQKEAKNPALNQKRKSEELYWSEKIGSMPGAPELPVIDKCENAPADFYHKEYFLSKEEWSNICQTAKTLKVTPTSAVLTAFTEIIGLWAKNSAFCVNITLLNRPEKHPQMNNIVGDFTSNIILDVNTDGSNFGERVSQIQYNLWESLEHSSFSGIEVLREMGKLHNKNIVLPIVFTSTIGAGDGNEEKDFMENARLTYKISQTPQVWIDCQAAEQAGGLLLNWDIRKGIFMEDMIDNAFEAYCNVLHKLSEDISAWERTYVATITENVKKIREEINNTSAPIPSGLLYDEFLHNVKTKSEKTAIVANNIRYTYKELSEHIKSIQTDLIKAGMQKGDLAAIILDKGISQIASVFGILLAGGVYIPILPSQPQARKEAILNDSGAKYVLTTDEYFSWEDNEAVKIIGMDKVKRSVSGEITPVRVDPEQPAYLIYTSGSSGKPKGVVINHKGVLNTIADVNKKFNVSSSDVFLGIANLSFDLSVYDIFGALNTGGTLVLPNADQNNNPEHWKKLLIQQKVTIWNTVPARMQMLVSAFGANDIGSSCLRLALLSGDWIPVSLPSELWSKFQGIKVISLGGATEASIWSIYYPIEDIAEGQKSIPYGLPLTNQQMYILNSKLLPCPDWTVGEICIGGTGLALEYHNDTELSEEKFMINPHTNERIYRTGDLGRYRPDGVIEFLGREDTQVKIRGHRIELGEIERICDGHPDVGSAVIELSGESYSEYKINAFVEIKRELKGNDCNSQVSFLRKECLEAADNITSNINRDDFKQWIEIADKTTLYDIVKTLKTAGLYSQPGQGHSIDEIQEKLGVVPKFHRLMRRWMIALCKEELAIFDSLNRKYYLKISEWNDQLPSEMWNKLEEIESKVHYGQKLINYLRDSSKNLTELLQGDVGALDLFFPQGSVDTAMAAYHDNLMNHSLNRIAISCVTKYAGIYNSKSRPIRILEVGAGVGGTSIDLIPALKNYNVEYHFSDISPFFLNEAKKNFGQYEWVTYGIYDINKNYWEQGLEASTYDIVVCANVLHNSKNIYDVMDSLNELCVPGGNALIIEATKEAYTLLTSMEFKEGLSGFTDFRGNTDRTFIDYSQWMDIFSKKQMELVCAYPPVDDSLALAGQSIFVAQFEQDRPRIHKTEILEYLQEYLPDYMIPNRIELLYKMPLTQNGKIDRNALKKRMESIGKYENAPNTIGISNEFERKIERIWANALNREYVGRDENFYVAGGDSLLIAQVIANMREGLEEAKSWEWDELMKEMLQTPTIAGIAQKLSKPRTPDTSKEKDKKTISPLVVIAEGMNKEKPIKALFHAGTGTLTPYNVLFPYFADNMENENRILGFSFGDDKEYLTHSPKKLIKELGGKYGNILLDTKETNFILMGYCMGGLIAIEAAKVLMQAGATIDRVITISTSFYEKESFYIRSKENQTNRKTIQTSLTNDLLMERSFGRMVGADEIKAGHYIQEDVLRGAISEISRTNQGEITVEALCNLSEKYEEVGECYRKLSKKTQTQRLNEMFATIPKTGEQYMEQQSGMLHILYKIFCLNFQSVAYYEPEPFFGNLKVLRCLDATKQFFPTTFNTDEKSWTNIGLGELEFEYIHGNHLTCLKEPNAKKLSELLL